MTKAEILALEKILSNDIDQALSTSKIHLPFQSKAKIYRKLEADGMVRAATVTVGTGWSAVTVTGWELTALGHLTCCVGMMTNG